MENISDVAVSMIVGENDSKCRPELALGLANRIPTMANFITLEGVGHSVLSDLKPRFDILANELTDEKPT